MVNEVDAGWTDVLPASGFVLLPVALVGDGFRSGRAFGHHQTGGVETYRRTGRADTGPRTVQVPPVLVLIIRSRFDDNEFADDHLIFRAHAMTIAQPHRTVYAVLAASLGVT